MSAWRVIGDARSERGLGQWPLWLLNEVGWGDFADADANTYANTEGGATLDADANAYANTYAYADAYAYAYANTDANTDAHAYYCDDAEACADANAYGDIVDTTAFKEEHMQDGLWAVAVTQGNLVVLRVGWFRRYDSDPDEWECRWAVPYRGEVRTRLSDVWVGGPKAAPHWTWGPPHDACAHRFHLRPLAKLDPALWASVVGPRPEGWS